MDYLKLLEQFARATDLPISVFEHRNLIFKGHSDKQDYNIPMFLVESLPHDLPDIWVSRIPERLFFGGLLLKQQKQLLILGPVSSNECSIGQCEQVLKRLGRKPHEAGTFQKIMSNFALCNIVHLQKYLGFLNYVLNEEEDVEITGIDFKWKDIFSVSEEYFLEMPPEAEDDMEDNILAFIRNGKAEELENYFNEVFYENSSLEKNMRDVNMRRNFIIGANIHISRIAIQEGVDVQLARNLSSYYLDQLVESNNLTDLNNIFYKLTVDYTKKIRSVQAFASEEMLPRRVNSFVQAHLYGRLSTSAIAEHFHINEAYLCEAFKKLTGQTIVRFIQESKIREARFLLEKGHSPTEVSDMLDFSSPSYFGVVFKKITGITPMEYRKSVD